VPAIVDETTGVTMSESANIVEYLNKTYGTGA
jgi:glutathione S-transferase